MTMRRLAGNLNEAKAALAAIDPGQFPPAERARLDELRRRLGRALELANDLAADVFALQEQNDQLRKDLAEKVCPRLCTRPWRNAS